LSIRQADPVPLSDAIAELFAVSDERDQWQLRLEGEYRTGYDVGYAVGVEVGRRQVLAEETAARRAVAARVAGARPGTRYKAFAEVQARRWGPGGREHFADPRPGDYPGRGDAA
jgi:hypothetical protein